MYIYVALELGGSKQTLNWEGKWYRRLEDVQVC